MGLFSFIKSAGEALAGGQPVTSESLVEHIKALGLKIDKLFVSWDGKTCVLFGNVPDQAEKEKAILAVGNLHGVDQVVDKLNVVAGAGAGGTSTAAAAPETVDPSKEPPGQAESQFYTVVSGDNLSHIAKHFYGDANKYPAIFEANKPMLKSPDKIYPGQVLRIPKQ
jgi:nucleoid-associated protein YgaU